MFFFYKYIYIYINTHTHTYIYTHIHHGYIMLYLHHYHSKLDGYVMAISRLDFRRFKSPWWTRGSACQAAPSCKPRYGDAGMPNSHWYSYGNIWHLQEEWIFPWICYTPGIPWHNWGSSQALLLGWEAAGQGRLGWDDDLCQFYMVENDGGLGKRVLFCPA